MVTLALMLAVVALGMAVGMSQPPQTYNGGDRLAFDTDSTATLEVGRRGDLAMAGLQTGDRVLALRGHPVNAHFVDSLRGRPYPFSGPVGDSAVVRVERADGAADVAVVLGQQDAADARRFGVSDAGLSRVLSVLGYLSLVAFAVVGVVLFVRGRGRGYLASMGLALVTAAGGGVFTSLITSEAELPGAVAVIALTLGAIMFFGALPALAAAVVRFPDGRYTPRWTRWVRPLAFLGIVGLIGFSVYAAATGAELSMPVLNGLTVAVLAVPLMGLIQKYRRSDGDIRQRMKWVVLPAGAFLAVFAVGSLAPEAFSALDVSEALSGYAFSTVTGVLMLLALAAVPLGMLAGVLGFRPWDADLWIARSAAIGAATLGLAGVFAASTEALRLGLRSSMGTGADAVAAALAAVVALVVFNPVREWLTRRADADLHRARERLTERLPLLLAGRQVVASPQEIGRVAIASVREALRTDRAAVIDLDPGGWQVVATDGVPAGDALEWADAVLDPHAIPPCSVQCWEDPVFVLCVPLRSAEDELVGVLALGTHGKGRGYSTEERKALDSAARPLAEALRVAERREHEERRQTARIAALVDRLSPAGDGAPAVGRAG